MKNLFISFSKDFILDTGGNNIILKYDLLNDIIYELGAELAFKTKDDSISDKARIISDIKDARPEDYAAIIDAINTSVISKLLLPEVPEEVTISFPDSYIDWMFYNSNQSYAAIGKKLRETGNKVTLSLTDIYNDYIKGKVLPKVRDVISADSDISQYTIVGLNDPNALIAMAVKDLKNTLRFEPYDGGWIQTEIGYAYNSGIGVKKDLEKSFTHYLAAAETRHSIATNWVGWCYQQGMGVKSDLSKALLWYNIGAEIGNQSAQANAAFFYENGMATTVDYAKAAKLYEQSLVNNNISFALNNLAEIYYNGRLGTPNYEKAFEYFLRETETTASSPNSLYRAGSMLYYGQGTEKDDKRAAKLLDKASAANQKGAHFLAGELHLSGASTDFGTPDYEKAKICFSRGAKDGDEKCALEYAKILIGEKKSSNAEHIIQNLKAASDKGLKEASFILAKYIHDTNANDLGSSYSPIAILEKLAQENYDGAAELLSSYRKEIEEENARLESERLKKEAEEQERQRRLDEEKKREKIQIEKEKAAYKSVVETYKNAKKYLKEMTLLSKLDQLFMFMDGARRGIPLAKAMLGSIMSEMEEVEKNNLYELLQSSLQPADEDLLEDVRAYVARGNSCPEVKRFIRYKGIDPHCYAIVGGAYFYGVGVPKDEREGLRLLNGAIGKRSEIRVVDGDESGYAYFVLANLYRVGQGVAKDLDRTEEYYNKAYNLDEIPYVPAQKALLLRDRHGMLPCRDVFPKLMAMGAERRDPTACIGYGAFLIEFLHDNARAEEWINEGIKRSGGNPSLLEQAKTLMTEIGGIPDDYIPEKKIMVYFDEQGRPSFDKPKTMINQSRPENTEKSTEAQSKDKKEGSVDTSEVATELLKSAQGLLRKKMEEVKNAAADTMESKSGFFGKLFGKKK